MRFIVFAHPPHLPKRWTKIYLGRINGLALRTTHKERATYLKSHSSWKALKNWLSKVSGNKCWYCEATSQRAPFDVDHFRPKLGITVDGQKLGGDTGYYWIAYEWWNFRLSCQRCNRPERDESTAAHGKANEFPIKDEGSRCAIPGNSFDDELPRLLDPCCEADCELLVHGVDGEVKPAAEKGTWEFERARYTIEQLGLNAFNCPENKKKMWQGLDLLIRHAGEKPEVIDHLRRHLAFDQEYSSFFRSAIGIHRDKPWVAALL